MGKGDLGKSYSDGEVITRQGDFGDCMYVVQQGKVQVLVEKDSVETPLRVATEGEFLGRWRSSIMMNARPLSAHWVKRDSSLSTKRTFSRGFTRTRRSPIVSYRPCRRGSETSVTRSRV